MSILTVTNLGKSFRTFKSEWRRVLSWFVPLEPSSVHWALRHVNFSISPGEAIAIIGENGAGKSTLLKLITGTLYASEGHIESNARIAAILELGMGFNPELTGRQNVWLAAGLLGHSAKEISNKIKDIENFAELDTAFEAPIRTYSSGMHMRLAFAIATEWRPEILIIDEALSVGDSYFQHKSFDRIRAFQKEGTTLLIVSHDKSAIQGLCERAILLSQGTVLKDGKPEEVFDLYNAMIAKKEGTTITTSTNKEGRSQIISGTGEAKVEELNLLNQEGQPIDTTNVGQAVTLHIRVRAYQDIPQLIFGYMIKDRFGQIMYGTNTWHTEQPLKDIKKGQEIIYRLQFSTNLGAGSYSISTTLQGSETHLSDNYEWKNLALVFEVVNLNKTQFQGHVWNEPMIEIDIN